MAKVVHRVSNGERRWLINDRVLAISFKLRRDMAQKDCTSSRKSHRPNRQLVGVRLPIATHRIDSPLSVNSLFE